MSLHTISRLQIGPIQLSAPAQSRPAQATALLGSVAPRLRGTSRHFTSRLQIGPIQLSAPVQLTAHQRTSRLRRISPHLSAPPHSMSLHSSASPHDISLHATSNLGSGIISLHNTSNLGSHNRSHLGSDSPQHNSPHNSAPTHLTSIQLKSRLRITTT